MLSSGLARDARILNYQTRQCPDTNLASIWIPVTRMIIEDSQGTNHNRCKMNAQFSIFRLFMTVVFEAWMVSLCPYLKYVCYAVLARDTLILMFRHDVTSLEVFWRKAGRHWGRDNLQVLEEETAHASWHSSELATACEGQPCAGRCHTAQCFC